MRTQSVIVHEMDRCVVCGSPNVEVHHIFMGNPNRENSDKLGFVVPLCKEHHTGVNGVHFNRSLDLQLKRMAQRHFEEYNGSREEFRKIFGKSWL